MRNTLFKPLLVEVARSSQDKPPMRNTLFKPLLVEVARSSQDKPPRVRTSYLVHLDRVACPVGQPTRRPHHPRPFSKSLSSRAACPDKEAGRGRSCAARLSKPWCIGHTELDKCLQFALFKELLGCQSLANIRRMGMEVEGVGVGEGGELWWGRGWRRGVSWAVPREREARKIASEIASEISCEIPSERAREVGRDRGIGKSE